MNLNDEERKSYSPDEVRKILGLSRSLTYRLIANGTIPSVRLGKRRLIIPVKALEELLENGVEK